MTFDEWAEENWILVDVKANAEEIWNSAVIETAKRCKEITQQRYLAENQAVEIDEKISEEFSI